mgnify:FL=1
MEKRIDLEAYPVRPVLERLLQDKTTKRNILFATDAYRENGEEFAETAEITAGKLLGWHRLRIQPRVEKAAAEQLARTRKKAEVFTPSWVVNKMNYADADWFGRTDVFNTENGISWTATDGPIVFDGKKTWKQYVDTRRIEITCGEAPYIVSRYDAATGEIIPLEERIGFLDRKLRVVNENAADDDEWLRWALRALQSSYGFEFQGDNLLLGRVNVLMTFAEYYEARFHRCAKEKLLRRAVNIISWNLWQMDGLTGTIPYSAPKPQIIQYCFFDPPDEIESLSFQPACLLMNWRRKQSVSYDTIRGEKRRMKWDFAIGNPAYQDQTLGENKGFAPPVYDKFLDVAFEIADKVEMIHPARFLFNAGSTPKAWNEKMLNDPHFKVLEYEEDASKVFANTDIKGGVAITYYDETKCFGEIKVFTKYPELNSIMKKAGVDSEDESLMSIIYLQNKFDLQALYRDFPQMKELIGSDGQDKRFRNNIFEKISVFSENKSDDSDISVLGVIKNKRVWRFIPQKYIEKSHENVFSWKVLVARVNGAGTIDEVLSNPLVLGPQTGFTQTFISVGSFDKKATADNALKYIKSKFARALLHVLKVTQDNNRESWRYVPLQDFTTNSDINWNTSIANIDKQLYKKYGLSPEEIDFIETHVKEMT